MKSLQNFALGCMLFVLASACMYGVYWGSKHLSYAFFYEDLVQGTVCQMVEPKHLVRGCD